MAIQLEDVIGIVKMEEFLYIKDAILGKCSIRKDLHESSLEILRRFSYSLDAHSRILRSIWFSAADRSLSLTLLDDI